MIDRYQIHLARGSEVAQDPEGLWCMQKDTEVETRRADSAETELRETASELERVRARLDEATGLLEDANHIAVCEVDYEETIVPWRERYQAFLSRAAAPEPSAHPINQWHGFWQVECERTVAALERAESAEAQLAAVREVFGAALGSGEVSDWPLHGCRSAVVEIDRRLCAHPTPGAGTGEPR